MRETFGIKEGVFIEIDKRIPVAAGLAGGSTDCAAVLVGMNRLFGLGLSEAQLEEVAGRLVRISLTASVAAQFCVRESAR